MHTHSNITKCQYQLSCTGFCGCRVCKTFVCEKSDEKSDGKSDEKSESCVDPSIKTKLFREISPTVSCLAHTKVNTHTHTLSFLRTCIHTPTCKHNHTTPHTPHTYTSKHKDTQTHTQTLSLSFFLFFSLSLSTHTHTHTLTSRTISVRATLEFTPSSKIFNLSLSFRDSAPSINSRYETSF